MDPDLAYANGAFIPGAERYPLRWTAQAAAFRASLGPRARLGLRYGPGARHLFDLFLPDTTPKGLLVFLHGGYWMAFGREIWSHLAAGAVSREWAVAMPSCTLAPDARLHEMRVEADRAVVAAMAEAGAHGPVVLTGHSAGGQLAARLACADQPGAARIARVVPISPLTDLGPLIATRMNLKLRIDAAEAAQESPARLALHPGCAAHVWVGGQERPAFLWHARLLSESWACPWTVAPGRHHFDVIDALADPTSPLLATCLDGLG